MTVTLPNTPVTDATLAPLDWIVILLYGAAMLLIGRFYSRRNKTKEDYLLGGRRMHPLTVGISLFATLLSTLSYLAYPGEIILHGPVIFAGMLAFPLVYYVVGWWLIPRIMKMNVTSAYEILELKLGLSVRMLATFMFLSLRFLWMATIIYVTVDIALLSVVEVNPAYVPLIGILLIAVTIFYTVMGGLRAVVLTDVIQTVIFMLGAILTIIVIGYQLGSFGVIFPEQWPAHWSSPRWGFDMQERMTIGNAVLVLLIWYICTNGSDQMALQRYLSTRDVRTARRSFRISLYSNILSNTLLALVGLALLAFFTERSGMLEEGRSLLAQADHLFPRFIMLGLPAGISGLVIAGLLAAAMSSLSSGLNSVSSVISEDLIGRFSRKKAEDIDQLKQVKKLSLIVGLVVMVLSIFVRYVPGNLFDVLMKVVNLFVAPLFVLFFMALFIPFATARGTFWGGVLSIASAVAIAFFKVFGITVLWIMPASLLVGILAGITISYIDKTAIKHSAIKPDKK